MRSALRTGNPPTVWGVLVLSIVVLTGSTVLVKDAAAGPQDVFRGRYVMQHSDDFGKGLATFDPAVELDDGRVLRLDFAGRPEPTLTPGTEVRIEGVQQGRRVIVAAQGVEETSPSTGEPGTVGDAGTGGDVTAAGVTKKVAVILFNFTDDTSQPYTPAYARGVAFDNANSVAAYYAENSWGNLTLNGEVFGWYTIPTTNTGCNFRAWETAAKQAATAAGVNLNGYDNFVYAFPKASGCGWSGLAELPGRNSWLNGPGAMALRTFAHELGHNFGTHHASTLSCTDGGVRVAIPGASSSCTMAEYGDPFTVMGGAHRYHQTNVSRGNFGWLQAANTQTVTTSGDYSLTPVEYAAPTAVQTLRVQRASNSFVTLEFRQPYGTQFETFTSTSAVATGVTVRIAPGYTTRTQSQLIDTTPETTTFADAPLAVGATVVDPVTGVAVTTLGVSSSGANVRITFPGIDPSPSPSPSAPPPPPTDTQPPSAPAGLSATPINSRKVQLAWGASVDDVGVEGYRVFRNGNRVGTVARLRFKDRLPRRGMRPSYYVVAFDAAGNVSRRSVHVQLSR